MLLSEYATTIVNAHQLQLVDLNLAASYVLGADVDATGTNSGASPANLWSSAGFVPLGGASASFSGAFSGLGHTITGLTVNAPSASDVGLFRQSGPAA